MLKEELKSLLHNKLLLVVLCAIILIPSIYCGFFLASMWDPYGELEYLPVAVVNNDESVEYNGKELKVGEELVNNLKENDSMAFNIVDANTAEAGLKNGTYYMVITIPNDFSANASTLMDENPKTMVLDYQTNPGNNYISMKLSESAMKQIKTNITEEVTRTYAEALFDSLDDVADGFDEAVDGTVDMIEGENQLIDGNEKITDNLDVLAKSTVTFANGSDTLAKGLKEYTEGVNKLDDGLGKLKDGADSLSSGTKQLKSGSSKILAGLNTMNNKLSKSLSDDNVKQIKYAAGKLNEMNDGIQKLNVAINGDGTEKNPGFDLSGVTTAMTSVGGNVVSAGTDIKDAGDKLSTGAGYLVGAYAKTGSASDLGGAGAKVTGAYATLYGLYASGTLTPEQQQAVGTAMAQLYNPSNMGDTSTAMGLIAAGTSQVGAAGSDLSAAGKELQTAGGTLNAMSNSDMGSSVDALKENVATLASASNQLLPASSKVMTDLLGGMQSVQSGLTMTEKNDGQSGLIEGMTALNAGIKTLDNGVNGENGLVAGIDQLKDGTEKLTSNNTKLNSGAKSLTEGADKISDGASKLADGSKTLGNGIGELKDGTKELKDALSDGAVEIRENEASDATLDMFSAPVDIKEETITEVPNNGHAMAAYMMSVGLWVGCLAFCLMYPLTEYKGKLKNGLVWWASKAAVAYPAAIAMAAVLVIILHFALGFTPVSMAKTFAIACITGIAFMSIMYFFNILLGKVGSFIMLIFMVLQLAGSAGTYPIEVSGPLAKALHNFVPFTYTVNAFRSAIAGGASVKGEVLILLGLCLVFTVSTIAVFEIRGKRLEKEKPIVYQWIERKGLA